MIARVYFLQEKKTERLGTGFTSFYAIALNYCRLKSCRLVVTLLSISTLSAE